MLFRLSIREMMAVVAVVGVILAAFHAHLSLGSFAAGALSVAWLDTARWLKALEAAGAPISPLATVGVFLRSSAIAAAVIAVSMLPMLPMLPLLTPETGCRRTFSPNLVLASLLLSTFMTIRTARVLRRWLSSDRKSTQPAPGSSGAGG